MNTIKARLNEFNHHLITLATVYRPPHAKHKERESNLSEAQRAAAGFFCPKPKIYIESG